MKRIYSLLLVLMMLLVLPSCVSTEEEKPENVMNMINPYVNHTSKKAAEKHVGFSIRLPEAPFAVEKTMYRENIIDPLLEIIMYGEDNELRIRKAPGKDDISGNWTSYPVTRKMTMGRNLVKLEGDEEKSYQATWTNGKYSYSAFIEKGLEDEEFMALIRDIR